MGFRLSSRWYVGGQRACFINAYKQMNKKTKSLDERHSDLYLFRLLINYLCIISIITIRALIRKQDKICIQIYLLRGRMPTASGVTRQISMQVSAAYRQINAERLRKGKA
jgi:hypothetical protein